MGCEKGLVEGVVVGGFELGTWRDGIVGVEFVRGGILIRW